MSVAMPKPSQDDWVKTVLFDRGYLPRSAARPLKCTSRSSKPAVVSPTAA